MNDPPFDFGNRDHGCVVLQKDSDSSEFRTLKNEPCGYLEEPLTNEAEYFGICQYKECKTKNGKQCIFPFRWDYW